MNKFSLIIHKYLNLIRFQSDIFSPILINIPHNFLSWKLSARDLLSAEAESISRANNIDGGLTCEQTKVLIFS